MSEYYHNFSLTFVLFYYWQKKKIIFALYFKLQCVQIQTSKNMMNAEETPADHSESNKQQKQQQQTVKLQCRLHSSDLSESQLMHLVLCTQGNFMTP